MALITANVGHLSDGIKYTISVLPSVYLFIQLNLHFYYFPFEYMVVMVAKAFVNSERASPNDISLSLSISLFVYFMHLTSWATSFPFDRRWCFMCVYLCFSMHRTTHTHHDGFLQDIVSYP